MIIKKCIAVLLCLAMLMPCSFAYAEKQKTYTEECIHLKNIEIPDSVTDIKYDTFEGCSIFMNVTVGDHSYAEKYCKDHHLRHTYAVKY